MHTFRKYKKASLTPHHHHHHHHLILCSSRKLHHYRTSLTTPYLSSSPLLPRPFSLYIHAHTPSLIIPHLSSPFLTYLLHYFNLPESTSPLYTAGVPLSHLTIPSFVYITLPYLIIHSLTCLYLMNAHHLYIQRAFPSLTSPSFLSYSLPFHTSLSTLSPAFTLICRGLHV